MADKTEGKDKHYHAHEVYEDFYLMKPYLSPDQDKVPHYHVRMSVGLNHLTSVSVELSHEVVLLLSLPDHNPHADEHLEYCLPQRKDVLELLPFELRDYKLVKDSNLCEPDDVVEKIVIM